MTVHFIHIGKTGGTAIKRGLRLVKFASSRARDEKPHEVRATPYGRIELHPHDFRMSDVPPEDFVFFCLRDPIERFVSAFYSRFNRGEPRYYVEWTDGERRAFEAFSTPQRLARALAGEDVHERALAQSALRNIRHMGPMVRFVNPIQVRSRLGHVVYIARQETLATDWEQLKSLLQLPPDAKLPTGRKEAHRRLPSLDRNLDPDAVAALKQWYRRDYVLLKYCDALRAWNGWGAGPPPEGVQRLRYEVTRMRGLPAVVRARRHRAGSTAG